jgi:hypothetical protein
MANSCSQGQAWSRPALWILTRVATYAIISVAAYILWCAFYCYVAQVNCIVVKFPGDAFICPMHSVLGYPILDKLTWQLQLNNHH